MLKSNYYNIKITKIKLKKIHTHIYKRMVMKKDKEKEEILEHSFAL